MNDQISNNIKIAYLLLVHKSSEQVNAFINQLLNYGESDVYIHIDLKNKSLADELIKSQRVKVYTVYDVRWGSFEIIKAACYLMKKVVDSGEGYSHIYFGSGQDLLVKKGLYRRLLNNPNKIYIRINREITDRNRESARYRIRWPRKLMIRNDWHLYRYIRIVMQLLCSYNIVIHPNKVKLKNQVKFFEGRTWFIIPVKVMKYILSYIENNPDYIRFWEDSLASDLMFFQTIIMNSPYANMIENELMYVEFGKTFGTMNHPLTITMSVVSKINNSGCYYARKFVWDEDQEVIEYYLEKTIGKND